MADKFYDMDAERPPLGPMPPLGSDRALLYAAIALGAVLFLWKLYVGVLANVIWEEGHFAVSGEHLALGYPDIPAGFPWLARLITSIFGWHVLPLRIVALLIATGMAPAVWFMAKPIVGHRNALWAAIFALLLPPLSLNGTIFYPEGALQVLQALMLGCLLRALNDGPQGLNDKYWGGQKWWILAGLCAAAGLLVHFRFLVPGLAVVVFLLATPQGRALWPKPGVWITAGIGFLGLLPGLIYNATEGWPAITFHVVNRPDFDPSLSHIQSFLGTQILVATPIFFIALVWAAWIAFRRDRAKPEILLGYQAVVIFLFFGLQSFYNKQIMPHWPFMAYVPLLPWLPGLFIAFAAAAKSVAGRWLRGPVIALAPLSALALGIACTVYQYDFVHSAELPYAAREHNILKNENWAVMQPELAAATAEAEKRFGPGAAVAATGHITAVRMEFPGDRSRHIYTLGDPYDTQAQFIVARKDWGLDRTALLKDQAGKGVVIALNEPSYVYHEPDWVKVYADLCQSLEGIERFKTVTLMPGKTTVNLYTARVRAQPLPGPLTQPCPLLPQLYIAHPTRGKFLKPGTHANFYGIAADPIGVTKVDVLIDHKLAAHTRYGLDPEGFRAPEVLRYDPNWPKVQYDFTFPEGSLVPGEHVLTIQATRTDGTVVESDPRILYVK